VDRPIRGDHHAEPERLVIARFEHRLLAHRHTRFGSAIGLGSPRFQRVGDMRLGSGTR